MPYILISKYNYFYILEAILLSNCISWPPQFEEVEAENGKQNRTMHTP